MCRRNRSSERRRFLAALVAALIAAGAPGMAAAQSARLLDAPRAQGIVGERYDGYAQIRGAAGAEVQKLVDQVNAERKQLYQQRAAAEHVPVEAIGKIYAQEILQSAPAGTWFLGENGQWVRK
jgi:uncharacterized protein YdbL (DUF1318 family)